MIRRPGYGWRSFSMSLPAGCPAASVDVVLDAEGDLDVEQLLEQRCSARRLPDLERGVGPVGAQPQRQPPPATLDLHVAHHREMTAIEPVRDPEKRAEPSDENTGGLRQRPV